MREPPWSIDSTMLSMFSDVGILYIQNFTTYTVLFNIHLSGDGLVPFSGPPF